jgi:integrase/recombinase XerD
LHRFLVLDGIRKDDPTNRMAPMRRHVKSVDEVSRLLETAHRAADDNSASLFKRASRHEDQRGGQAPSPRGTRTSTRHLLIRGGDKERLVPLNEKCLEAMLRWRKLANEYGTSSGTWLLHAVRDGSRHLTPRAAKQEIKEAAAAAGLSRPELITPHVLRHVLTCSIFSMRLRSAGSSISQPRMKDSSFVADL